MCNVRASVLDPYKANSCLVILYVVGASYELQQCCENNCCAEQSQVVMQQANIHIQSACYIDLNYAWGGEKVSASTQWEMKNDACNFLHKVETQTVILDCQQSSTGFNWLSNWWTVLVLIIAFINLLLSQSICNKQRKTFRFCRYRNKKWQNISLILPSFLICFPLNRRFLQ